MASRTFASAIESGAWPGACGPSPAGSQPNEAYAARSAPGAVAVSVRQPPPLAHPSASLPLKVAGQVVPNQVVFAVLAFFFVWVAMLISMTLLLGWSGVDPMTAFSAVTATLCNIGPGLNKIGPTATFAVLTDLQLWICVLAMLFGRLELFTVLVVFTPTFWRK